jgi:hypothetical protein
VSVAQRVTRVSLWRDNSVVVGEKL